MQRMMDDAMNEGACGLSTGLIYAPGLCARPPRRSSRVGAPGGRAHGGFYASHIRGEGATLLDAVREAIRVGREGGAARAGEPHQGGRPAQLGQGRRRAGADRRAPAPRGST